MLSPASGRSGARAAPPGPTGLRALGAGLGPFGPPRRWGERGRGDGGRPRQTSRNGKGPPAIRAEGVPQAAVGWGRGGPASASLKLIICLEEAAEKGVWPRELTLSLFGPPPGDRQEWRALCRVRVRGEQPGLCHSWEPFQQVSPGEGLACLHLGLPEEPWCLPDPLIYSACLIRTRGVAWDAEPQPVG